MTSLQSERINGLIEVPDLAASLTLNKGDFIRTGTRGAVYLAYRKAIQETVSRQLEAWGDGRAGTPQASSRMMRPLERDLDRVLEELSDDFPLLAAIVERRAGGQKRLPIDGRRTNTGAEATAVVVAPAMAEESRHGNTGPDQPPEAPPPTERDATESEPPSTPSIPAPASTMFPGQGRSRSPLRYGLGIQFEDRPNDSELGRLVESTVWINQVHPAYRRALASRSVGYHISLTVALALAPLAVEPDQEHTFITKFLSHWGQALEQPQGNRRRLRR